MDMSNRLNFSIDLNSGNVELDLNVLKDFPQLESVYGAIGKKSSLPFIRFVEILKSTSSNSFRSRDLPYGTVLYEEGTGYFLLVQESKEFEFFFNHSANKRLLGQKMIFPRSYFVYVIPINCFTENRPLRLSKTYIFIEEDSFATFDKNKKYRTSFLPNYSSTYSTGICWGGDSSIAKIWSGDLKTLSSLEYGPTRYVNSEFNNDLTPELSVSILHSIIIKSLTPIELHEFFAMLTSLTYSFDYFPDNPIFNPEKLLKEFSNEYGSTTLLYSYLIFFCSRFGGFPYPVMNAFKTTTLCYEDISKNPLRGYV